MHYLGFLHIYQKTYVACNFICHAETEGFLKVQAVTYTVNVIISEKRC